MSELDCDILIVGGGVGGCAAAIAAASHGRRVILTEEGGLLGGQLVSQLVPPDEHPWIETFGCTRRYRAYRDAVRAAYDPDLTPAARLQSELNPGGGWVSRLCHTPAIGRVALAGLLAPGKAGGDLQTHLWTSVQNVQTAGDLIEAVTFSTRDGRSLTVRPKMVLDATELGELLPLARAEYRIGAESQAEFGEPHATSAAEPDNVQGFTWCFALGLDSQPSDPIEKPASYDRARAYRPPGWPGPLLSFTYPNPVTGEPRTLPLLASDENDRATLFAYRQIVDPKNLAGETRPVTAVNWPQNDYFGGSILDVPEQVARQRLADAKDLGLCLLYWLQTEAPRHDGGAGYPEIRLRPDIALSEDGFAPAPYHREARRIVSKVTVTEPMICVPDRLREDRAPAMPKSVGIGYYRIDLHPSANGHGYIDIPCFPFQIPLGCLIPVRLRNLLAAGKNLGVTHVTNGCYRLHPVEWNVGEAAGLLAAFCVSRGLEPAQVLEGEVRWQEFERLVQSEGIETAWPDVELRIP